MKISKGIMVAALCCAANLRAVPTLSITQETNPEINFSFVNLDVVNSAGIHSVKYSIDDFTTDSWLLTEPSFSLFVTIPFTYIGQHNVKVDLFDAENSVVGQLTGSYEGTVGDSSWTVSLLGLGSLAMGLFRKIIA